MVNFLIALTENDKKLIIALVLVFIVILALLILIVLLTEKICKQQGKKLDRLMHDVVITGCITDGKQFKKVAGYKNRVQFFREARIPFIIVFVSLIAAIIYMGATQNWNFAALFSDYGTKVSDGVYSGGTGFATILYLWDYSAFPTTTWFGMTIVSDWAPLIQAPHFEVTAIFSYFFCVAFVFGLAWFLFTIQAFAARTYRMYKLENQIFGKSLDNVTFDNLFNLKIQNGTVTYDKQEVNVNNKTDNTQIEQQTNTENKDQNTQQ